MVLGISLSVTGLICCKHVFVIWAFIVLGSFSSAGLLSLSLTPVPLATFFVSSVLGGLLFIISSFRSSVPALLSGLALMLCLGFFPFQFWSLVVLSHLPLRVSCFFLGPMKLGYFFLLLDLNISICSLGMIALLLGTLLFFHCTTLSGLLWSSSSCLLLPIVLLGSYNGFLYFAIYCLALLCLSSYRILGLSLFLCFSGLGGLPPLLMFWAKFIALSLLPTVFGILVILSSIISVIPYFYFACSNFLSGSRNLFWRLIYMRLLPICLIGPFG